MQDLLENLFYYGGMKVLPLARLVSTTGSLIPSALAAVAAGFPSPSQDYESVNIDLNDILITDRNATFLMRVTGNSMRDAGIADGDEVIVDRSRTPISGNIVVAAINGEFTIKRFIIDADGAGWLHPENSDYPEIPIPEESDFLIFGVVTRCLHHVL